RRSRRSCACRTEYSREGLLHFTRGGFVERLALRNWGTIGAAKPRLSHEVERTRRDGHLLASLVRHVSARRAAGADGARGGLPRARGSAWPRARRVLRARSAH